MTTARITAQKLRALLHSQHASLSITLNEPAAEYRTVAEWAADWGTDREHWVSERDRDLAIERNEVWVLQWYPLTPVSSWTLYGASLESVLRRALEIDAEARAAGEFQ